MKTSPTPGLPGAIKDAGTRYDAPSAGDGRGGPHPLAGVPQAVLDAAVAALTAAGPADGVSDVVIERGDLEPVAHAVLLAALVQWRQPACALPAVGDGPAR